MFYLVITSWELSIINRIKKQHWNWTISNNTRRNSRVKNNEEKRRVEKVNRAIEDFGGFLKDYRKENFLTLEDMAQEVGCSSSYIFRIEKNTRNPEINFRIKILTLGMNWSTEDVYLFLEKVISKEKMNKKE